MLPPSTHDHKKPPGEVVHIGYALGGKEVEPTSPEAHAVRMEDGTTKRYWLKFVAVGPEAGNLFNPYTALYDPHALAREGRQVGRNPFTFRPVGPGAFFTYINFLRTGAPLHVRHAQRMVHNRD